MDDNIIQKIKKLFALAKSTNENEAAAALKKAQELMAEYNITEHEIRLSDIKEIKKRMVTQSARPPLWSAYLMALIKDRFGLDLIIGGTETQVQVLFVGHHTRVEVGSYCYEILSKQLSAARKQYLTKLPKKIKRSTQIKRADLFCEGWINCVAGKVSKLAIPFQEKELITQFIAVNHKELVNSKVREVKNVSKYDRDSKFDGYVSGLGVNLNAGIKNNTPVNQLSN